MNLPLFPLNTVLFPGMVLPLHIFEPRYRAMIGRCIETSSPFGVVLIEQGSEVAGQATPHEVGTAARIVRSEKLPDDRLNITAVGTQRFRILELDHSESYLTAEVRHYPVINGATREAANLVYQVRPRITEYVELLAKASNSKLQLDKMPEDPSTLAFLIAIALQINNDVKQDLLAMAGIPEILVREHYLLGRELLLMRHMVETQDDVSAMTGGPTGYIFPN